MCVNGLRAVSAACLSTCQSSRVVVAMNEPSGLYSTLPNSTCVFILLRCYVSVHTFSHIVLVVRGIVCIVVKCILGSFYFGLYILQML